MFERRTYIQNGGYKGAAIRFADKDGGVATTAYSFAMSDEEKFEMARRITAAMNLTRNLTTEQMESTAPLPDNHDRPVCDIAEEIVAKWGLLGADHDRAVEGVALALRRERHRSGVA